MPRPIVFLTDFGLDDAFVGVCHGVVASIAPSTRVLDLTHTVPPQDVRRGALLLAEAAPYMPRDAVYLAVVDPGVGTQRRAVAVQAVSGALFVGPDNGLMSLAWRALGGAERAVMIEAGAAGGPGGSTTFHGRDLFSPAAARLSIGLPLEELGSEVDPASLAEILLPEPEVAAGALRAEVLQVDRFGNAQSNVRAEHLEAAGLAGAATILVESGGRSRLLPRVTAFGEVGRGEAALLLDSAGRLAVVVNHGSGAERLGLRGGDPLTFRAAS